MGCSVEDDDTIIKTENQTRGLDREGVETMSAEMFSEAIDLLEGIGILVIEKNLSKVGVDINTIICIRKDIVTNTLIGETHITLGQRIVLEVETIVTVDAETRGDPDKTVTVLDDRERDGTGNAISRVERLHRERVLLTESGGSKEER